MKNIKLIFFTFILLGISISAHAEQYLCTCEHITGFSYDKVTRSWQVTIFNDEKKYVIAESKDKEGFYTLTKSGDSSPLCTAESGFSKYGDLFFDCLISEFRFSRETGRYLNVYPIGYWNSTKESDEISDTPYIEIGVCSPF